MRRSTGGSKTIGCGTSVICWVLGMFVQIGMHQQQFNGVEDREFCSYY